MCNTTEHEWLYAHHYTYFCIIAFTRILCAYVMVAIAVVIETFCQKNRVQIVN